MAYEIKSAHSEGDRACDETAVTDVAVQLRRSLNALILGKADVIECVLACLLARGHLLFDDLPGMGKTTLAKGLATQVGGHFGRIQCTPDLLPSDVTGFNVFNQRDRQFEFMPGPVFADVLLADEINRATPRTQSALFEAMAERQVTIDGRSRPLSPSFFVIATQNPVESHGAYPLPEAQLDRFAMKLHIGYPDRESEIDLLGANIRSGGDAEPVAGAISPEYLAQLQQFVETVHVAPKLRAYLVDAARAIRAHPTVQLGVSPRGLIIWQRLSQAWAALNGRDFVTPDDIQAMAKPVLRVRITGDFEHPDELIQSVLEQVPVPA
ncbi:MAG TPA: MoxR family ATPase [Pirellulaceae bacterium]|nr:MoxR family ATPase [Pirellulaceae bacterium]